jgi:hypothetical protein
VFLKLTMARDGATVYVHEGKIQSLTRRPEFDGLPVHTAVMLEHTTIAVLEKPKEIITAIYEGEHQDGVTTVPADHSPESAAPVPAASPR